MFNSTKLMFIVIIMFSTMFSISSNSWIGCWMGLEINLLCFIPIISMNNKNLLTSEASMKYFIVQSFASLNFLMFLMLIYMMMNWNKFSLNMIYLLNFTLMMKMGAAPFHFWFPNIMESMNWMNCFIISTWQKIAPLIILSYCYATNLMYLTIVLSSIFGAIGGINQNSLRKLLSFSSINHLSWMIITLMINNNIFIIYFSTYMFMNMMMMMMFNMFKSYYLNQLINSPKNFLMKIILFMNLLSLGGLPPLIGFLPKWLTINFLIMMNSKFIMMILMMTTLITLFYYIQISYSFFMLNYLQIKWFNLKIKNIYKFFTIMLTFISLINLIMISMII
uniref:NADH dehydrogenase subunit 2 n=1 Tax=Agapetus zniachtl TaxID=1875106 RepID=UPI0022DCE0E4|nr:NADH dehydrogenase subunit 2 [Agapetus zniachtl]UZZ43727.1 NADH dehydrogenase subunit 2 [Agapetus zniachtl]